MPLVRITPPAVSAIAEADVLDHLRLESGSPGPSDLALIRQYVAASVDALDGAGGFLGRCLISQTWRLKLERFPAGPIKIPLPPVQEVVAVTYLDAHGLDTILDPAGYIVAGLGADDVNVRPRPGRSWPATDVHPEAVEITFVAGYGDTPEEIPAPIRGALMEMVATRYEHRESAIVGGAFSSLPASATSQLADFQSWSQLYG